MKKVTTLIAVVALSFISGFTVMAQEDLSKKLLPMDPKVKVGVLPNGLKYYIMKNAEPKNRAQLRLMVKAGSVLENDEQQGLAHFMEHMNFNGTKNFPKNELVDFLQKSGVRFGADLNAYTSFDETVYMLPVPTDSIEVFKKGIQILEDWAHNATLDPTEIDKERGVVLEESRTGKGAQARMRDKFFPIILNNSQYAKRLPIGKDDILKNFKYDVLKQFHQDFYRPDLEAVAVVGDVDVAMVEKMIIEKFSGIQNPANEKPRTKYKIDLSGSTDVAIITDPEQPNTIVQIMNKQEKRKDVTYQDRREGMLRSLFNQMLSGRIQELTQKADPPFQYGYAGYSGFLGNLDAFNTVVVAKGGNVEKGLKAILEEVARAKKFGFNASELQRAKTQYMVGQEQAYKEKDKTDSEQLVEGLVGAFLEDENLTSTEFGYEFTKQYLEGIKLEEVNALGNLLITDTNRAVILMAPEKDKATLPTEAQIREWLNSAGKDVTAYVDQTVNKPLIAKLPTGSKVIATKQIPEVGLTEYTFANGVKAVLKPTDFKNDEILIGGYSFGGSNLYGNKDADNARVASAIASMGGLGDFSTVNLRKALTGKVARVSPFVSGTTEGISGSSNPKDLETALQLLYSYFTQPRFDADVVKGFLANQRDALASQQKTLTPEKVYSDSLTAILSNYAPRNLPMTVERLEKIDATRAFQIYKERFADASDFTFFFVGNFKNEEVKPLLEKYLGGLPSTKRKETYKDLGIRPPKGKVEKTLYKGTEPKARVTLVWSGDFDGTAESETQVEALSEVLEIKLIEKLREEESGVYGVGVSGSTAKIPAKRYNFRIAFGCAPENVEKLVARTLAEIEKVKEKGAEQTDIDKFKVETKRQTETQLRDNGFWMGYLQSQYQEGDDVKYILKEEEALKKVTVESTKTAAKKYFGDNVIKVIMLPEKK
ncbi:MULTISPECIES: insulinase family protein [unclassified Arcicella]|uniref:M16 family metallopeptidase n=1 Tax=unclassified Arcicella TaxID=2644986 RepID=UPI002860CE7D|nr:MULTISPECIES: insulinase family protein [unclassified Arcicella]MDR6564134.1 zinc protease [Arcicella sp. BE51]MDR6813887.1 zinc protease [Arcicella sp. BE140]MDR6825199.1 zinc protease [Arcicella sp. BE139]